MFHKCFKSVYISLYFTFNWYVYAYILLTMTVYMYAGKIANVRLL